ncbi:MAG TPA: Hsp20/alpha crystallin family protein [Thermomicrobiales bacterium]|jgi:HSP20 family protein
MIVVRRGVQRDPERVQQEMEQVFRALMPARPRVAARQSGLWRPPLEVYETDEALVIIAEVAGLDERQLSVVVDQAVLAIRGERPDPCQAERRSYREAGIPYGAFGAEVYIPFPIDADGTVADYQNGFLRIVLPKAAPRTIVPRRPEQDGRGKGAQ